MCNPTHYDSLICKPDNDFPYFEQSPQKTKENGLPILKDNTSLIAFLLQHAPPLLQSPTGFSIVQHLAFAKHAKEISRTLNSGINSILKDLILSRCKDHFFISNPSNPLLRFLLLTHFGPEPWAAFTALVVGKTQADVGVELEELKYIKTVLQECILWDRMGRPLTKQQMGSLDEGESFAICDGVVPMKERVFSNFAKERQGRDGLMAPEEILGAIEGAIEGLERKKKAFGLNATSSSCWDTPLCPVNAIASPPNLTSEILEKRGITYFYSLLTHQISAYIGTPPDPTPQLWCVGPTEICKGKRVAIKYVYDEQSNKATKYHMNLSRKGIWHFMGPKHELVPPFACAFNCLKHGRRAEQEEMTGEWAVSLDAAEETFRLFPEYEYASIFTRNSSLFQGEEAARGEREETNSLSEENEITSKSSRDEIWARAEREELEMTKPLAENLRKLSKSIDRITEAIKKLEALYGHGIDDNETLSGEGGSEETTLRAEDTASEVDTIDSLLEQYSTVDDAFEEEQISELEGDSIFVKHSGWCPHETQRTGRISCSFKECIHDKPGDVNASKNTPSTEFIEHSTWCPHYTESTFLVNVVGTIAGDAVLVQHSQHSGCCPENVPDAEEVVEFVVAEDTLNPATSEPSLETPLRAHFDTLFIEPHNDVSSVKLESEKQQNDHGLEYAEEQNDLGLASADTASLSKHYEVPTVIDVLEEQFEVIERVPLE